MTEQEQNERIAVLLGWERADTITPQWFNPTHLVTSEYRDRGFEPLPDFSQWDRFPELQEYVRGLDYLGQIDVFNDLWKRLPDDARITRAVFHITPSMLRDAVLACVNDEVSEGSASTS